LGDTFEPGMGYVALSRVRSLSGLKLMNLNEMALRVHPKVLAQDHDLKNASAMVVSDLQMLTDEEKAQGYEKTLITRFEGCKHPSAGKIKTSQKKNHMIPTHLVTRTFLKENMSLDSISKKRSLTLGTILHHVEKLKGLKQIEPEEILYLKDSLASDDFNLILFALKRSSEDGKMKPIYEEFEGKYTYTDIQLVRLFL
jgi:ATP-dependent DNA helicase PIF1